MSQLLVRQYADVEVLSGLQDAQLAAELFPEPGSGFPEGLSGAYPMGALSIRPLFPPRQLRLRATPVQVVRVSAAVAEDDDRELLVTLDANLVYPVTRVADGSTESIGATFRNVYRFVPTGGRNAPVGFRGLRSVRSSYSGLVHACFYLGRILPLRDADQHLSFGLEDRTDEPEAPEPSCEKRPPPPKRCLGDLAGQL